MLSDAPLETFLEEHPQITSIRFCLDNDVPGRKATEELTEKYYSFFYPEASTQQMREIVDTFHVLKQVYNNS